MQMQLLERGITMPTRADAMFNKEGDVLKRQGMD
jgi:hypothetical protein